jgi:hypothetical protein
LASAVLAITFTSIFGCASMKRMRRGMSQREANEGSTLTVSRSSRRVRNCSAACTISSRGAAHALGEGAAGGGERHALAVAREERRAHVFLERAHLVAYRAVGECQLLGGTRKALEACGGLEWAQRGQGWEATGHV